MAGIPGTNIGVGIQSAGFWASAVDLQLRRIEGHRAELLALMTTTPADPDESWARQGAVFGLELCVDAYMLVLAAKHVRGYAELYARNLHDAALTKAIGEFDNHVPNAKTVRNVLEHWDAYVVGKGNRGPLPDQSQFVSVEFEVPDDLSSELVLNAGGHVIQLRRLGVAAIALAREATRAFWVRPSETEPSDA